eukprot:TRINITY_DN67568_c0_g1_i1.p2 TRINITY_DN67568_c0_g1~~TRINITY_DN67568_c0_g1_i1.p2  ORF type:complete len:260 (+),score=36.07 TRINITY_DN67568_c0_g1_i1:117-896(+)
MNGLGPTDERSGLPAIGIGLGDMTLPVLGRREAMRCAAAKAAAAAADAASAGAPLPTLTRAVSAPAEVSNFGNNQDTGSGKACSEPGFAKPRRRLSWKEESSTSGYDSPLSGGCGGDRSPSSPFNGGGSPARRRSSGCRERASGGMRGMSTVLEVAVNTPTSGDQGLAVGIDDRRVTPSKADHDHIRRSFVNGLVGVDTVILYDTPNEADSEAEQEEDGARKTGTIIRTTKKVKSSCLFRLIGSLCCGKEDTVARSTAL